MGTGRTFNKDPISRPRKTGREKARRLGVHKKRLMSLGMIEADMKQLTCKDIRELLRTPKKTAANLASAKVKAKE